MKCPHCQTEIHGNPEARDIKQRQNDGWAAIYIDCPACNSPTIFLVRGTVNWGGSLKKDVLENESFRVMAYPRTGNRPPAPPEVPSGIAEDYNEASLVLEFSPKASAALSRRCLQHLLREKANVKHGNLAGEISEAMSSLPSHLSESIDAIRNIGNFSAHPLKSTSTNAIISVEPGEAEWLLEVLQQLFDFYCVQPELTKKRRDALNKKLVEAGKKPMK